MPLDFVRAQAALAAEDDERRRREAQQRLAGEEAALAEAVAAEKRSAAEGPAALLEQLQGGRRAAVSGDVLRRAEEDRFLNQQGMRRLERRAGGLEREKRDLAVPGPSAAARFAEATAPLGRFAFDTPTREDLPELRRMREGFGNVSRETSAPVYTDAPRATGRDDAGTMPYTGALDGLLGLDVPRAAIRQEFGGTAPDTVLSFSDRPESGMRRYASDGGRTKDVGAPGGGLASVRPGERPGAVTPESLIDELIRDTERLPLTEREVMGTLAKEKPTYDVEAANLADPGAIEQKILTDVGEGRLDPGVGQELLARYGRLAKQVTSAEGEFAPDVFQELLQPSALAGPPAPERLARAGEALTTQAAENERQAVTEALQPVPGAPGEAPSPALQAEGADDAGSGFFAQLAAGAQAGARDRFPASQTGPELDDRATAAGIARYGLPMAGSAFGPVGGAVGAGAGEVLAGAIEGDVDPGAALLATLLGGVVPAVGRRVVDAVQARRLARGLSLGMEGVTGAAAPEAAGAAGSGLRYTEKGVERLGRTSTLDRARQASAEAGAGRPGVGDWYDPDLVPVRDPGFALGRTGATESVGRPLRSPRLLPGPAEPEVLAPAVAGDVIEGEVVEPATMLLRQLFARGAGEGAKQLVPAGRAAAREIPEDMLGLLRSALENRRRQDVPVSARDVTELLAMLQRAGA